MNRLLYQGHGSFRLISQKTVVYVDPYAGTGYDMPADLILVTHGHHDHDQIDLPVKKSSCVIITHENSLITNGGNVEYRSYNVCGIHITAVPASNKKHSRDSCAGYIVKTRNIKLYFAGDTSRTAEMASMKGIDYAFLPIDGIYNMDEVEAAECAAVIGAKHAVPVHMAPGKLFDLSKAEKFKAPNRMIMKAGTEYTL